MNDAGACELPPISRKPLETSRDPRIRRKSAYVGDGTAHVRQDAELEQSNQKVYEKVVRWPPVRIKKQSPARKKLTANATDVVATHDVRINPASVKKISLKHESEIPEVGGCKLEIDARATKIQGH